MARKVELEEAKQRAARFCAFQERSPKEVSDKLKSWGLPDHSADEAVRQLITEGFVEPQRFANAYCNDKFEFNSWGKQKIRANIFPHKLDSDIVDRALSRIDDVRYFERVVELASKKWTILEGQELTKQKQKTLAYLKNKGFESDVIWKAINQLAAK
ncbi:MAG: regulatory protein RecX [Cyclobacteriaceae bacterium]